MKVTVLGTQNLDYVSRRTGNPVKGLSLFCKYFDSGVVGEAASRIFISDNLNIPCIADIVPGCVVDVEYNNRGYVCGLSLISRPAK